MTSIEYWIAAIMLMALCAYVLTGGADFGGGVLDLLCFGKRAQKQRALLEERMAPVWEANHVWLIVIIVLLFVCFPSVFETVCIFLNIPLTILLVGITLRGAAFVFRAHDVEVEIVQRRWSLLFSFGSILSPLMLGICLGTVSTGFRIEEFTFSGQFVRPWLQPFPVLVGLFTIILCAFLASLYAVQRASDEELRKDFRQRALLFALLTGVFAFILLAVARTAAPHIFEQLLQSFWAFPFQVLTGVVAVGCLLALCFRFDRLACVLGMLQVLCLLSGWALAQFPYMIVDTHSIAHSAAPAAILKPVFWTLIFGSAALIPSFAWLYWVFRR